MRLIKRCAEFPLREEFALIPHDTRGIYSLLNCRPRRKKYEVVYVGQARGGYRG